MQPQISASRSLTASVYTEVIKPLQLNTKLLTELDHKLLLLAFSSVFILLDHYHICNCTYTGALKYLQDMDT